MRERGNTIERDANYVDSAFISVGRHHYIGDSSDTGLVFIKLLVGVNVCYFAISLLSTIDLVHHSLSICIII